MSRVRAWRGRLETNRRVAWFWYTLFAVMFAAGVAVIVVGLLEILTGVR